MGTLARIGFFGTESHPVLRCEQRPTFKTFLCELLKIHGQNLDGILLREHEITEKIVTLGYCKEKRTAVKAAKTIM